jgi:hypothetical protein
VVAVVAVVMPASDLVHISQWGRDFWCRRWGRYSKARIVIETAKVQITGGEKCFAGGINSLPDNIENMTPHPWRQIDPKLINIAVAVRVYGIS